MQVRLSQLADLTGGVISGDKDSLIEKAAPLHATDERAITFATSPEKTDWNSVKARAVVVPKGTAGKLEKAHPVLRPMSEYRPYTPDRILRKEEGPLYVFYELDKVRLLRSFSEKDYHRDNGPVLDEIMDVTAQILSDTTSSVKVIQIVGLASIEGRLSHNVWLADERALSLQKYIQERLSIPDSMFETVGGGEAWSEFRDQINDLVLEGGGAGLTKEQLQWVINVIDTEPDVNRRESILKKKDGGALFAKLKANVLQDQRNSGYLRIYYDYVPDESAREINSAIDLMASGDYAGALKALEAKRPRGGSHGDAPEGCCCRG